MISRSSHCNLTIAAKSEQRYLPDIMGSITHVSERTDQRICAVHIKRPEAATQD